MSDTFVCVGTVLGVHGLKGMLTVYSDTRPASGIAGYSCWKIGNSAAVAKPYQVLRCWQHGKGTLAELEGVNSREQAEALKQSKIWVATADIEVDEDEYLWDELVGCDVYSQGDLLGQVTALEAYGAQDILTIASPESASVRGEWMLPFTEDVIECIDMDERRIDVILLEGMDACFTPKS